MIFTSQSGRISIKNPDTIRITENEGKSRWEISVMDRSGSWVGMAIYPTETRCMEVKESWIWEESIGMKEFRFPLQ